MGKPPMSFSHLQLYQSGEKVPKKMHHQQFFTLIRDEPKKFDKFVAK